MITINLNYLPDLLYPDQEKHMELDICIPSLNIAFEYQGDQHYKDNKLFGSVDVMKKRDDAKREACKVQRNKSCS